MILVDVGMGKRQLGVTLHGADVFLAALSLGPFSLSLLPSSVFHISSSDFPIFCSPVISHIPSPDPQSPISEPKTPSDLQ